MKNRFYWTKRIIFISLVIFIILVPISAFILPVRAIDPVTFPNSFDKINYVEYQIDQDMNHWVDGDFSGGGILNITYDHAVNGQVSLDADYSAEFWQKACTTASNFSGRLMVINNVDTRWTLSNPYSIGSQDLDEVYVQYFLGNCFSENGVKLFFLDDLWYLHNMIVQREFELMEEEERIYLLDGFVDTIHIQWVGSFVYAGYICGIGEFPQVNCTVDYYYEPQTGILVYSSGHYLEYLTTAPTIYQDHILEKRISDLGYEGQPDPDQPDTIWDIFTNNNNEAKFWSFIVIVGSILLGIVAIVIINKKSLKWRAKAIMEYEKKYGSVDLDPEIEPDSQNSSEP